MIETDVLYHNCRLFKAEFGNRYLFVKHMKKYITLCRRDILRTYIECSRGKLPQKHFCICGDFLIIFCHLRGFFSSAGIFSQFCCLRHKATSFPPPNQEVLSPTEVVRTLRSFIMAHAVMNTTRTRRTIGVLCFTTMLHRIRFIVLENNSATSKGIYERICTMP
jgi:hypothetical protein